MAVKEAPVEFARHTTCLRLQYVLYVTHWSACGFYFIALQHGLEQDTWIGRHFDDVVDMPIAIRCISSMSAIRPAVYMWVV